MPVDAAGFEKAFTHAVEHRSRLTWHAFDLYKEAYSADSEAVFLERSLLLSRSTWLPAAPVPVSDLRLVPSPAKGDWSPLVSQAAYLWPPLPGGNGGTYAHALESVGGGKFRPRELENLPVFRLAHADGLEMRFGQGEYFDHLNVGEAMAFEMANADLSFPGMPLESLPLREAVGEPWALDRRPVGLGICTLTLRRQPSGDASFFMHYREPGSVATSRGTYNVIPAGEFQPEGTGWERYNSDLNLRKTVWREYREELLGEGAPESMDEEQGKLYFLGLALDPLTLKAEALTACVFEADYFDSLVKDHYLSDGGGEGPLIGGARHLGMPFDHVNVFEFISHKTLPAGRGCLGLAWKHREALGIVDREDGAGGDARKGPRL